MNALPPVPAVLLLWFAFTCFSRLWPCLSCSAQYDADQLPESKRTLTKALHLAPTDHQLRFNVALTLQVGGGGGQGVVHLMPCPWLQYNVEWLVMWATSWLGVAA